jgi:hypothetical protein
MAEPRHEQVKRAIQAAEGLYHRLVLVVGNSGSGKTSILRQVAEDLGTCPINVNLALSRALLELTARQRSLRVAAILDEIVADAQSPVILDNLELLFDTDLAQDPLRLLQRVSRNRTVVASWNGTVTPVRLVYGEPGHPEYRRYDSADVLLVAMDGMATMDSTDNDREAGHT